MCDLMSNINYDVKIRLLSAPLLACEPTSFYADPEAKGTMFRDRWQETLTGVAFRRLGGVSRRRPARTRSEVCHQLRPSEDRPLAALRDDHQALTPKAALSQKNGFVRSPFSVGGHSVYMDRITRSRPFG